MKLTGLNMFFMPSTSKEVGLRRVNKPVEVNKRTFITDVPTFLNPKHVVATPNVQVNKEEILHPILKKIDGKKLPIIIKKKLNLDNENKNVKVEEEIIHPILKNLVDKKIPIIILRNEKRFDVDVLKYLEKNHYKEIDYKYYYPIISLVEYERILMEENPTITLVEYEKSLMEKNPTITLVEYERSLMEENEKFKNQLDEDQINNVCS